MGWLCLAQLWLRARLRGVPSLACVCSVGVFLLFFSLVFAEYSPISFPKARHGTLRSFRKFSLSTVATLISLYLSKMVQSLVSDNNSYFFNDTTNVDSGSEYDVAYETDLIDTDIDAEETIHDGEDSNLIHLLADNEYPL